MAAGQSRSITANICSICRDVPRLWLWYTKMGRSVCMYSVHQYIDVHRVCGNIGVLTAKRTE